MWKWWEGDKERQMTSVGSKVRRNEAWWEEEPWVWQLVGNRSAGNSTFLPRELMRINPSFTRSYGNN